MSQPRDVCHASGLHVILRVPVISRNPDRRPLCRHSLTCPRPPGLLAPPLFIPGLRHPCLHDFPLQRDQLRTKLETTSVREEEGRREGVLLSGVKGNPRGRSVQSEICQTCRAGNRSRHGIAVLFNTVAVFAFKDDDDTSLLKARVTLNVFKAPGQESLAYSEAGTVMMFAMREAAAMRASMRPFTMAPVPRVID